MNDDAPLISIIIPTFNRERTIGRAIESVINQTFKDWELLIIDDGSTDGTKDIIGSFEDSRIIYHRHDVNMGLSAALNTGIKLSRGKYIAFLDDDDIWLAEKLECQLRRIEEAGSRLGVVACGIIKEDKTGREYFTQPKARGYIYKKQLCFDHFAGSCTWLARRHVFFDERVGLFDEELPSRHDYDMSLRISQYYDLDYVEEALVKVYTLDIPDRISDNSQKVLSGELMIRAKVEERTKDFPSYERRRILSGQNLYIGFDLLTVAGDRSGFEYLVCSLKLWPINIRTLCCIFLYLLGDSSLNGYRKLHVLAGRTRKILAQVKSSIKKLPALGTSIYHG